MLLSLYNPADIEAVFQNLKSSITSVASVGMYLLALVVALYLVRPTISYFLGLFGFGEDSGHIPGSDFNEHRFYGRRRF